MKDEKIMVSDSGHLDENEISFVDILLVLAKYKKILMILPFAAALVGTAIAFLIPPSYRAVTSLLPPQQAQSSASALLSQLGGAAGVLASATGIKNPSDVYVGILKSRTIADKLIDRFQLVKVYDENTREDARAVLEKSTSVAAGKDGIISVAVEDKEKKRSAELANAYVEELTKLTKIVAVTEAGQRRLFYERQLETVKNNLASAEMSLKGALDKNGVMSVDGESRAIIETSGRLRAALSAKEIQLASMRPFMTPENPEFKKAQQELLSLRVELERLTNGREDDTAATPTVSPAGLSNIKILRDVKYNQMLYEVLAKQYEVARLDEARDSSVIQVLDAAIEPERKFKPKRAFIILFSTAVGLFLALIYIVSREKINAAANGGASQKWAQLRAQLRTR